MQNLLTNTVLVPAPNNAVININAKNLPFSNNFIQTQFIKTMRTRNGRNAFVVIVKCTANSMEPGRSYICMYTQKGTLLACNTLD